jgi:cation transport protein ChaC
MTDLWVFGYGSLMWRPGFPFEERVPARVFGAHRSLCVLSHTHRGTKSRPGLVLGLDHGGSCRGVGFRVAAENGESVIAYLRRRELDSTVYLEVSRPMRLDRTRSRDVRALCYVVDRRDPQYAGNLDRGTALEIVRGAHGHSGPNRDYVVNTANHLKALGIDDPALEWIAARLR